MIWDDDGEGSLSSDEIIKAFVQIGLSQDHHFAKKIMANIQPPNKNKFQNNNNIMLKDFIKIFRKDEVSENLIKVINQEVKTNKNRRSNKN